MIQILEENRKPTRGENFATAVGGGINAYAQYKQAQQKKQQLALRNEMIKEKFGYDLTGFNEDQVKAVLPQLLKGQQKQEQVAGTQKFFEELQNKNKGPSMGDRLASGGQQTQDQPQQDYIDEPTTDVQRLGRQKLPYSEEDIVAMETREGGHAIATQMRQQNEAVERQQREELKANAQAKKQQFTEQKEKTRQREFAHTESKAFDENLTKSAVGAKKKNEALTNQMGLVDKVGWYDRAVSALAGNTPWGTILKSANAQEFDSYTLPQLEGLRQLLGGVLSDSDIRLIMQKVVTSDKKPEANKKIAQWLSLANNADIAKEQIGAEIKQKNGGYRPIDYVDQINQTYAQRYGNDIKALGQDILSLQDDPKKAEKFRRKVPPGTQLSESVIDFYLKSTNDDPEKAMQWAIEDGYDVG